MQLRPPVPYYHLYYSATTSHTYPFGCTHHAMHTSCHPISACHTKNHPNSGELTGSNGEVMTDTDNDLSSAPATPSMFNMIQLNSCPYVAITAIQSPENYANSYLLWVFGAAIIAAQGTFVAQCHPTP